MKYMIIVCSAGITARIYIVVLSWFYIYMYVYTPAAYSIIL